MAHVWRSEDSLWRSVLSVMWVLGTDSGCSGLAEGTFTC